MRLEPCLELYDCVQEAGQICGLVTQAKWPERQKKLLNRLMSAIVKLRLTLRLENEARPDVSWVHFEKGEAAWNWS